MLKFIEKRDQIGEYIYLLYFVIMCSARSLGLYEGMTVYTISLAIGLVLFGLKMLVTKYTVKEYVIAAVFLALASLVYLNSGEKGLLVCFTMILGMKGVSSIKVIKAGILVPGTIILAKIFLGVFGILPEIYYPQLRGGIGFVFRHALGYAHPNSMHMNVLMLSMMVIYLVTKLADGQENGKWFLSVASLLVLGFNFYVFQYSGSRTGILACIVYLFVNAWLFFRGKVGIFEQIIAYLAFPLTSFVAIAFPKILSEELYEYLDSRVFTTRLFLGRVFINNNKITLFGSRLVGYKEYGIDMGQLYLFLQLGIVAFIFMAVLTTWFIYRCIKTNRFPELAIMLTMLFISLWEAFLYNLSFKNLAYIFMGEVLFETLNRADVSTGDAPEGRGDNDVKWKLKPFLIVVACSIAGGCIISGIYLGITKTPNALYGIRQENEKGVSFDMTPLYFSEEEISALKKNGDIVLDYVDETTPVYQYDKNIAVMEYHKRAMSTGVWSTAFLMMVLWIIVRCYFKKRQ